MSFARDRDISAGHGAGTRAQILATADRLLRERPYRELSVDLVMAQTELSRTAFYRHFEDIPDLVLHLLAEVGQELYAIAERWRDRAMEDFTAASREGLAGLVGFMREHGRLVRAVGEAAATDEAVERGYEQFREVFTRMIAGVIERYVERGLLDVPEPRSLALALNLGSEAFLLDQFGAEPAASAELALPTLQTIWLQVLSPRGEVTARA